MSKAEIGMAALATIVLIGVSAGIALADATARIDRILDHHRHTGDHDPRTEPFYEAE